MFGEKPLQALFIYDVALCRLGGWHSYLQHTPMQITTNTQIGGDLARYDIVVVDAPSQLGSVQWQLLENYVAGGGNCLLLVRPTTRRLPGWAGVTPGDVGPVCELRVLFSKTDTRIGVRLPDAFYLQTPFRPLQPELDDVETLLYADWRFTHQAVLTCRTLNDGKVAATTLLDFENGLQQQLLYRILRDMAGRGSTAAIGVGLLGYAPSVGQLHGQGVEATAGLALRQACDLNGDRLTAARETFPSVEVTADMADLAANDDVDLVIIATPPNTHARLAIAMLEAGKHVVCEKPLALNRAEVESMRAAAANSGRFLGCHQNRRWDSDYLAIKQALSENLIGDLFLLEAFVGGYAHPCGYWHSDERVSGGATYDWGAHYIDWILDLTPGTVTEVIATRQNRVWHDITNADHERIQLRFDDGVEAEFVHSDLAFLPKPKWYLLGTTGAIIGQWRQATAYAVDPVHYYDATVIPSSELGAEIAVRRRNKRGEIFEQTLPQPKGERYAFHRDLADHLLTGEPITVPVDHSARVVAVLEAAKRSVENGSRIEAVAI